MVYPEVFELQQSIYFVWLGIAMALGQERAHAQSPRLRSLQNKIKYICRRDTQNIG